MLITPALLAPVSFSSELIVSAVSVQNKVCIQTVTCFMCIHFLQLMYGLGVGLLTTCTAVALAQQYILMTFLAPNSIQVYSIHNCQSYAENLVSLWHILG